MIPWTRTSFDAENIISVHFLIFFFFLTDSDHIIINFHKKLKIKIYRHFQFESLNWVLFSNLKKLFPLVFQFFSRFISFVWLPEHRTFRTIALNYRSLHQTFKQMCPFVIHQQYEHRTASLRKKCIAYRNPSPNFK